MNTDGNAQSKYTEAAADPAPGRLNKYFAEQDGAVVVPLESRSWIEVSKHSSSVLGH